MLEPGIGLLDLGLRAAAIGQIALLCLLFLRRPFNLMACTLISLALCTTGYLLLTAPVEDTHYGPLRGILLVLTDSFAYAIWLAAMVYFRDDFSPRRWPWAVKLLLGLYALGFVYYFGVRQGIGRLHDLHHLLSIILILHVIFYLIRGMQDDLVDARRKLRVYAVLTISVYNIYLACVELSPEAIRHHWLFNLSSAAIVLFGVSALAQILLRPLIQLPVLEAHPASVPSGGNTTRSGALLAKLNAFIAQHQYTQSNLTITALARQLDYPEYQLRQLINNQLGYRNFTDFLNHHRLKAAISELQKVDDNTPILTLALNLGYGSIGPFNRAFKAQLGLTPGEYRRQFQNRS